MEARKKRHIDPGYEYDALFPGVANDNKTIRRNANLDDTVAFIPKVVKQTLYQTERIAKRLNANNVYDACRKIWQFVYRYINYKKDDEGFEQIRSPARAWHDRQQGVDCDCYSVFISSILTNLGIPHILRITKYHRNHFQHIYPVVPHGSRYITLDCVTDYFDYEVPFTEKKDYPMDLQYLDGLDGETLGLFGKKKKKKAAAAAAAASAVIPSPDIPGAAAPAPPAPPPPPKKKGFLKKVLNVVNKVNPATLLLRNGVLAAMKLNVMNVARRLRWSYLTPEQAVAKGLDPVKFQKLVATRQKLDNIFYGGGGNPENLKKAILTGKGNKDKAVSGLGMLPIDEWTGYMNENTPLKQLLGPEIYYSENVEGMEGFQGFGALGEPITLATVGAAMGVIAGIVAALKQIGDVFKNKGEPGSEDFDEALTTAPENNVNIPAGTTPVLPTVQPVTSNTTIPSDPYVNSDGGGNYAASNMPVTTFERSVVTAPENNSYMEDEMEIPSSSYSAPLVPRSNITPANNANENGDDGKQNFWQKNKKWIKPVAIGVGGLTLIAIGFKLIKGNKAQNKSSPISGTLSGIPKKRKKKSYRRKKQQRKKSVALL